MKRYVIDSDILIYFLKGNVSVIENLTKISVDNLYITRINYTELIYGAYNSSKIEENLPIIYQFVEKFKILEFDQKSSIIFARLKANLKQNGKLIADMDLMIASISLANNCVLATNNTKHFARIKDLKNVNLT